MGHTLQMTVYLESKMAESRDSKGRSITGKIVFYSSSYFQLRALKPKIEYTGFDYRPKTDYNKGNFNEKLNSNRK